MGLITSLIVGALAGWLAGLVMKGRGFGLLGNMLVGVIGAFVGSRLFYLLGIRVELTFFTGILVSFVGAVVVLGIVALVKGARKE